ncbi:unnamed protein product [Euphydryas editha]|uniref:Uncharacterized protein n=1 Tax=Euphydryas editha TaxID=104508 RepID=A0AAU9V6J3_EUPED|nr:unnamed protein product [Euphydryas editha]
MVYFAIKGLIKAAADLSSEVSRASTSRSFYEVQFGFFERFAVSKRRRAERDRSPGNESGFVLEEHARHEQYWEQSCSSSQEST